MFRFAIILVMILCFLASAPDQLLAEGKTLKATKGLVDENHPAPDGYYIYYSSIPGVDIDIYDSGTYNLKMEVPPDATGDMTRMIVLCNKDAKFVVTAFCEAASGLPEDRLETGPGTLLPDEPGEEPGDIQENEYFDACVPRPPIQVHFEVPPPRGSAPPEKVEKPLDK